MIGGDDKNGVIIDKCFSYSFVTGKHKEMPSLPILQSHFETVIFKERVFILCGLDQNGVPCNFCQAFNIKENKWECIKELPVSLRKPISFIYNDHLHIIGIETEGDSEFLRIFSLSDDFDKWKEVGGRFFTESKNEINNFQTLPTDKPNELWLYVRHGWMIMNNTFLKLDLINQEMICDWEIEFENSDRDDKIYVEDDFLVLLKMRNNNLYKVNFDLINLVPQFS